jgi:hypothetical protein
MPISRRTSAARAALGAIYERPTSLVAERERFDWCDVRLDTRLAERVARQAMREAPFDLSTILVAEDGSWFRLPHAPTVELKKRTAICRILAALVEERLVRPANPLAVSRLVAKGWPGERIVKHAATNRLYVALDTLRRLGLRRVLRRNRRGYWLDETAKVERVDPRSKTAPPPSPARATAATSSSSGPSVL